MMQEDILNETNLKAYIKLFMKHVKKGSKEHLASIPIFIKIAHLDMNQKLNSAEEVEMLESPPEN